MCNNNKHIHSSRSRSHTCICINMHMYISRDNELYEIVKLASRPLPDRPQGMVCVAIYTTSSNWKDNNKNNNMEAYEILARNYPGSLFLMNTNMNNSINNNLLLPSSPPSPATITTIIHVYAGGKRVAQIVENSLCGGNEDVFLSQLQHELESQLQHAPPLKFDLLAQTPSSSLPTETIDKVAEEYDFESSYGNWLPNVED